MQQSQRPWTQLQRFVKGHSQFCETLLVKYVSFNPAFSFLSTAEITVRGKVSTGTLHTSIITQKTTGSKCVGGSYLKSIKSVWIGGEKEEICWDPYTSDPTYVPPTD